MSNKKELLYLSIAARIAKVKSILTSKDIKIGFIILTAFSLPMPYWVVELGYDITPSAGARLGMYSFFYSAWDVYHFWMHFTMLLVLINLIYLGTVLVNE
jgi:hypothetical protein